MTTEFDADTAVQRVGAGSYAAELTGRWDVGGRPNGGYLIAVGTRALADALPQPDPLTVTGHFLRPPTPGPAAVEVEVVRAGRRLACGQASLSQDGREFLRLLATFGSLAEASGPTLVTGAPPDLPPPESCVPARSELPGGITVAVVERFDLRLHPATVGWALGRPGGGAEVGGWIRFADGRAPDLTALVQIVDALPPAVFDTGVVRGWVPTVELTVHPRAHPAPGWLRVWSRSRFLIAGYVEEDVEVWDARDRLVAQSRQLARVRAPGEDVGDSSAAVGRTRGGTGTGVP